MATRASTHGRQCERNPDHWLDPTWDTCPYCEAEERAKKRSHTNHSSAASGAKRSHTNQPSSASGSKRKSTLVSSSYQAPRKVTKVMPDRGSPRDNRPPPGRGKRVVAGLFTNDVPYSPEGHIFEIFEGRNYIGAGNIASEAPERPCDILIEEDQQMSSEHALIRYVQGTFEIVDKETTNGTFVNGNLIPTLQGHQLENYDKIKTGKTNWTLIIIAPKETTGEPPAAKPAPPEPDREPDRGPPLAH